MARFLTLLAFLPLPFLSPEGALPQEELAPCGLGGVNIVANGGFDTGIGSWSAAVGFGTTSWSRDDASGSLRSGSIQLVNDAPPSGQNVSVSQCSAIQGGLSYDLRAKIEPVNFCCLPSSGTRPLAIEHTGSLYVLLNFYSKPSCSGGPLFEFVRVDAAGKNVWQSLSQTFTSPASAASVLTTLAIFKAESSNSPAENLTGNFDDISITRSAPSDPSALCLGGRFKAQAQWTTADGQSGPGQPVALTSDTGYFYFFGPNNVEMLVKVLDACGLNSRFWVFAGGLTNVKVVLTITDVVTGAVQTYTNPQGTAFFPIQDTGAFASCGTPTAARGPTDLSRGDLSPPIPPRAEPAVSIAPSSIERTSDTCVSNTTTLCLNNNRFSVTAQWTTPDGQTGPARVVPLTAASGYFWFFNPSNVEMIVKVLNACGVSPNYWVFAAGLTNLQVVTTVTDLQTGVVRTYTNPQGAAFQPIQDTGAFPTCP